MAHTYAQSGTFPLSDSVCNPYNFCGALESTGGHSVGGQQVSRTPDNESAVESTEYKHDDTVMFCGEDVRTICGGTDECYKSCPTRVENLFQMESRANHSFADAEANCVGALPVQLSSTVAPSLGASRGVSMTMTNGSLLSPSVVCSICTGKSK